VHIKIFIVDDYNIFRSGLKLILEKHKNFKVVGEALNSNELFNVLDKVQPNVIVLNLTLPHKHIISITKKLFKKYPEIAVVLLTFGAVEYVILECIINGARGILWKESSPEQLVEAIVTVASGERYLDIPESKMVSKVIQHAHSHHYDDHNFTEISDREEEVLKLFTKGYSYKQIGIELNISPRTVESHKNNILSKLNLQSVTEMIKYAIRHNLVEI